MRWLLLAVVVACGVPPATVGDGCGEVVSGLCSRGAECGEYGWDQFDECVSAAFPSCCTPTSDRPCDASAMAGAVAWRKCMDAIGTRDCRLLGALPEECLSIL